MLSVLLSVFMHMALFSGFVGYAHPAASTPPSHSHVHVLDSGANPPTG